MVSEAYLDLWIMLALMTKLDRKAVYAITAIATLIGMTTIAPAFATHYASNGFPPYTYIERVPNTPTVCVFSSSTACANVWSNGDAETFARAPSLFQSFTAIARLNQNQANNQIGSPPQITTTETPTIGIAFEVYVTARGQLSGAGFPNVAIFKYGGQTWKLVSGTYQKDQVFSKDSTGNGVKNFADKARMVFSVGPGTYRLGGQVFSIVTNNGGGTPISDFYFSDAGGDYKSTVTRLAICHPATSTTACPT